MKMNPASASIALCPITDELVLSFPDGHSVNIPATPKGMGIMHSIFRERNAQTRPAQIGSDAEPVQYDIDKMVRKFKKNQARQREEETAHIIATLSPEMRAIYERLKTS